MMLFLASWLTLFFLPQAYYKSTFTYADGETPHFVTDKLITVSVAVFINTTYALSDLLSRHIGFWDNATEQFTFILFYFIANLLNLVLDAFLYAYLAYKKIVVHKTTSFEGEPIANMTDWVDIAETTPLQKGVGQEMFEYAVPGTLFIPYLVIEPLCLFILPYFLARWKLRSTPGISGQQAESMMQIMVPLDLSRYGDHLINLSTTVLVCFFPCGLFLKIAMSCMFVSIAMYLIDHYRLLRETPSCSIQGRRVDRLANLLLCVPVGLLLVVAVSKSRLKQARLGDGDAPSLGVHVIFAAHVLVHCSLLSFLEWWTTHKLEEVSESYADVASSTPANYFNANPVHCLRSLCLYKDEPPCVMYAPGKEHLLKANPKIGLYFEALPEEVE